MEQRIKGTCENCGFAHMGVVKMNDGVFPDVLCPECGLETQNFDDAETIDEQDEEEGVVGDYTESTYSYK